MRRSNHRHSRWIFPIALIALLHLSGCHSASLITFTEVPFAGAGGPETSGMISGKVDGKLRNKSVVLYSYDAGRWWVQPFATAPFTTIRADGSWNAQVHLGTKYAALLTRQTIQPPSVLEALPAIGKGIEAIITSAGKPGLTARVHEQAARQTIRFQGYEWEVRTIPGNYAAKSNPYSATNVSIDSGGALHLRLTRSGNAWTCAELHSTRTLGYGTYRIGVRNIAQLEPAAMFSLFTLSEGAAATEHGGMDIHFTRWGDPVNKNAEFVVQPYFVPANVYRFELPPGHITAEWNWSPEAARFAMQTGPSAARLFNDWTFTSGVPSADGTQFYINLCAYGYAKIKPEHEAEVVVDRFEFLP